MAKIMDRECLFSIFMCTRNSEKTLRRAIGSVLRQSNQNWELIIVDNGSDDGSWEIVKEMMEQDGRVKGIHLEENIGWAKGAGLCLNYAKGSYMTFLAADDFFMGDGGLHAVEGCIQAEGPDIVWVGHAQVQIQEKGYILLGGGIPEYKVYGCEDKVNEIFEIMNGLYYNSFFHFIRIGLLEEYGINFFAPFYGDCEGVTEAMCRSCKAVVLDQAIYALTLNTSQTRGGVGWRRNVVQWRSIKRAVCEEGKYSYTKLRYIAIRIFNNNLVRIRGICDGTKELRNEEMNPISKTSLQRLRYVEEVLESPEYNEMFYYAGRGRYVHELLKCMKILYAKCIEDGYSKEEIAQGIKWADRLVLAFYTLRGNCLEKRNVYDKESFRYLREALCHPSNTGMFGFEMLEGMVPYASESISDVWEGIFSRYVGMNMEKIYDLLFLAVRIKRDGDRKQEVLSIVKECADILSSIKEYVPEKDVRQAVDDIKMVALV